MRFFLSLCKKPDLVLILLAETLLNVLLYQCLILFLKKMYNITLLKGNSF